MTRKKTKDSPEKKITKVRRYDDIIHNGVGFLAHFQRFSWDFIGVFLLAFALITLIALFLPQLAAGNLITFWRNFVRHAFGYGAILVVIASLGSGLMVLRLSSRKPNPTADGQAGASMKLPWGRIIALELAGFAVLGLLSVWGGRSVDRAELGLDGGFIGWGLAELVAMGLRLIGLDRNIWGGLVFGLLIVLGLGIGLGLISPLLKRLQKMTVEKQPAP